MLTLLPAPYVTKAFGTMKRCHPGSPCSSPKKMKTAFGSTVMDGSVACKKLITLGLKLTAKALGLVETSDGLFVPASDGSNRNKKNQGRPLNWFKEQELNKTEEEEKVGSLVFDKCILTLRLRVKKFYNTFSFSFLAYYCAS